jgi:hypothetical protein
VKILNAPGTNWKESYDRLKFRYDQLEVEYDRNNQRSYNELKDKYLSKVDDYKKVKQQLAEKKDVQKNYNELNEKYSLIVNKYDKVKQQLTEKKDIVDRLPIYIHDIEYRNEKYNQVIDNYGEILWSKKIRFLNKRLDITNYSETRKEYILNCKIFTPDNVLLNKEYTKYTHSDTINIEKGRFKASLAGWGNNTTSIYESGKYKMEIWFENRIIFSDDFQIYRKM